MAKPDRVLAEKERRLLIVAHGDLDGIISAVLVGLECLSRDIRIDFAQPFTVDKVEIPDDVDEVVVVDLAINNRDPLMTMSFINRLGDKLLSWTDHHQGWEPFDVDQDHYDRFEIDPKAPSCASMLGSRGTLVEDATAADTRQGKLSWRADLIERATKANLSDNSVREAAFWWLLGDEGQFPILEKAARKYAAIQEETERLSATYQVTGQVALVDARSAGQYDLTQLLLAGQKLAPFAVAQTVNPSGEEGLTIATSRKDVSLVELFGLGSGAPFRVSISADRLEEALEKLSSL